MTDHGPQLHHIRVTNDVGLSKVVDIVATAFHSTALSISFIREIDNIPPPYPSAKIDISRRRQHFAPGILDGAKSGSEVVQAGDWSAIAIWEPPGFTGKPFSEQGYCGPIRAAWRDAIKVSKARHLGERPFWHLAFLARNPNEAVVPGAISAVMRPFIRRAEETESPAWLEAVDERGVKIYEHYGFRLVEKITLGEGRIGATGWPEDGGEGVSGYAMIYEPPKSKVDRDS